MTLEPDTPIVLVGMPGSGKSTVGRRLAEALGRRFVDSDREIERHCGVSVATIFEYEGEEGFRRREAAVIAQLIGEPRTVLATGGGSLLRQETRALLAARGYVIFLDVSLAELWRRVRRNRNRPLLQGDDPHARLAQLCADRTPLYREAAALTVSGARQPAAQMVADIIAHLPEPLQVLGPEAGSP